MKQAYIITNSELVAIVGNHLKERGFEIGRITVRCTEKSVVVAGVKAPGVAVSDLQGSHGEDCDYEEEENEDGGCEDDAAECRWKVRACIIKDPHTASEIAAALEISTHEVMAALAGLTVEAVTAKREDGRTVPAWMLTGTVAYDEFVAQEKSRVDAQVEKHKDRILGALPKFYESGVERPGVVEACVAGEPEEVQEELRRDGKAVFYRMEEQELVEHKGHSWRRAKTEVDHTKVVLLQGTVREILMTTDGVGYDELADKLPGFVEPKLLRHAVKRLDGVSEQGGQLYFSAS